MCCMKPQEMVSIWLILEQNCTKHLFKPTNVTNVGRTCYIEIVWCQPNQKGRYVVFWLCLGFYNKCLPYKVDGMFNYIITIRFVGNCYVAVTDVRSVVVMITKAHFYYFYCDTRPGPCMYGPFTINTRS